MRISRLFSRNSVWGLALLAVASSALAQDSARQAIENQGSAAMEKLGDAIARRDAAVRNGSGPSLPDQKHPAERRRAFEGLSKRVPNTDMEARARMAAELGEASLAREREAQAKRLRQALGLEPSEGEALAKGEPPAAAKSWVPVLFVSSSIPVPVLRSYAAQLERVRGVLAFRGMPGGLRKVGPMARLSAEILRRDPGCEGPACAMRDVQLIVDPILFRQHGVARVPALAMIPGDPMRAYCERDEESPRARFLVFGDSALPGLFDEYARLGGRQEVKDAQALLAAH